MVQNDFEDEFPLLRSHGLYASPISGDGNCLFHALSDQLYGHENAHQELRASIVSHMRRHASYFKLFLSVPGTSRKSKGKSEFQAPSESAIDAAFEQHLRRMCQLGVYGDNTEICAFAQEFGVDVKIYQRDFAYVVAGGDGGEERKIVHIAYHTWEHYSSIRNLGGPHSGLPEVKPVLSPEVAAGVHGEGKKSGARKYALPWMVNTVMKSLPFLATEEEVAKALEECKGDVNEAVGRMLDKEMGEGVGEAEGGVEVDEDGRQTGQVEKLEMDGDRATPEEKPPTPPPIQPKKGFQKAPKSHALKKEKTATASSSTTSDNSTPKRSTNKPAALQIKPKRESARERKERQKAEAAERKRSKGAAGFKGDSKSESTTTIRTSTKIIEGGIRELYI